MRYALADSTGRIAAFYADDVHGPRTIQIPDPNWKAPAAPDPLPKNYVAPSAPLVSAPNPACTIPVAAVEITDAQWQDAVVNPGKYTVQNGVIVAASVWPTPEMVSAQAWTTYKAQAAAALSKSDTTVARISEAIALGVTSWTATDVVTWMKYRRALRAILSQTQPASVPTALPSAPAYPAGT
ncbi:MAG: hypothetical protein KGL39_46325 [Patescibacteria group bacterium]|nr:hypothetical protein [Patescibacteria group bacterium]